MRLSKDDFLKADDRATEEVDLSDLPGYHGSLLVRGMTGEERDRFEASVMVRRGDKLEPDPWNVRAKLVAWTVVDDDGNQVFDVAEVELIGRKSSRAISRLYDVAARLSGISENDIGEMTGNFSEASTGPSSSGSPSTSTRPSPNSSPGLTPVN